ncbi:hypothetical protein GCM10027275_46190 [Rhabdobacter roseus]|uniref:Putative damage-inducible protein DinB n=1 Tax=Rhabdobacter roseus TaxID=1655419 RepID=A0A840TS00_9BACT|nr:DinB family protein [Rhabdobacter roseus]MBB5286711.1 putative damage-inducible protein DinB [Rhabdobacter roseus]
MTTDLLLALWLEGRTRFTNQLAALRAEDLPRKLPGTVNSVGFLIRHVAEVELLFAKNVFKQPGVRVQARTVMDKTDSGEWTNLPELREYQQYAFDTLYESIRQQAEADWPTQLTTAEFGTKTRAEALGRIVTHTAYHAGQMALILKYTAQVQLVV